MAGQSTGKSGGNNKIGRDKKKGELYFISQRRYKNKIRKARKRYGYCKIKNSG